MSRISVPKYTHDYIISDLNPFRIPETILTL